MIIFFKKKGKFILNLIKKTKLKITEGNSNDRIEIVKKIMKEKGLNLPPAS
jgi:hypothetical protein